jgi:hypothetical protein
LTDGWQHDAKIVTSVLQAILYDCEKPSGYECGYLKVIPTTMLINILKNNATLNEGFFLYLTKCTTLAPNGDKWASAVGYRYAQWLLADVFSDGHAHEIMPFIRLARQAICKGKPFKKSPKQHGVHYTILSMCLDGYNSLLPLRVDLGFFNQMLDRVTRIE